METIAKSGFFSRNDSEFHGFPAEDKAMIHLLLRSMETAERQYLAMRLGTSAGLLAGAYWLFSVAQANQTAALLVVMIGVPLIAFVESINIIVVGSYRQLKAYVFEPFETSEVYRNVESGINAILQKHGWTFVHDIRISMSAALPSGIYRYDSETKKPMVLSGRSFVEE